MNDKVRLDAFLSVAPLLPVATRNSVLLQALAIIRRQVAGIQEAEVDDSGSARRELAALVEEARSAIASFGYINDPKSPNSLLGSRGSDRLLREVLNMTRSLKNSEHQAGLLNALAPHLPNKLPGEVLAIVHEMKNDAARASTFASLATKLPRDLLVEAVSVACNVKSDHERVSVLSSLVPCLPEPLLWKALASIRAVNDLPLRVSAISSWAPYLTQKLLRDELTEAGLFVDPYRRAAALSVLAPHLPPGLQGEAIRGFLACLSRVNSRKGA